MSLFDIIAQVSFINKSKIFIGQTHSPRLRGDKGGLKSRYFGPLTP